MLRTAPRLGRAFATALLVPVLLLAAPLAGAEILVLYRAEDQPDTEPAKDLWRYTYAVTGHAFAELEGFTLYFEADAASELALASSPAHWTAATFNPDRPLLLPGGLVAQATASLAAESWEFSVEFVRRGNATPGPQRYELFDADFAVLDPPGTLNTATQAIPEAQTSLLMLVGFALLAALSMRRRVARPSSWR